MFVQTALFTGIRHAPPSASDTPRTLGKLSEIFFCLCGCRDTYVGLFDLFPLQAIEMTCSKERATTGTLWATLPPLQVQHNRRCKRCRDKKDARGINSGGHVQKIEDDHQASPPTRPMKKHHAGVIVDLSPSTSAKKGVDESEVTLS
ncbi:hypothetical protein R1flu_004113 [Riccia fluitans]|uniref:Uncharacterized protein n=1 Tax=Riccia fluitans TaxID=41844 RepID=A0ABD1YSC9_9MARC